MNISSKQINQCCKDQMVKEWLLTGKTEKDGGVVKVMGLPSGSIYDIDWSGRKCDVCGTELDPYPK